MPRLITFGASVVYGFGLPDCYSAPGNPGPNPSKFAWPQLLADKLGYECLNLSRPALGNFQIFLNTIKTEFEAGDLVITAWSFFARFDKYELVDVEGNGRNVPPTQNKNDDILAKLLKVHEHYPIKNFWDNWLTFQHSELYLNRKNIRNFSFMGVEGPGNYTAFDLGKDSEKIPRLIQLDNMLDVELVNQDKALDGKHPGIESHRLQAQQIYDRIKDRI